MKKFFLSFVFLSLFSQFNHAQTFSAGPELGSNVILLEKTELGRNYHLCWYAGGNAEYYLTDYISFRSGIYFSQRKKIYEAEDTSELTVFGFEPDDLGIPGADFSVYTKTKGVTSQFGLEMPFLTAFNFKGISVFAGPYIHFMVGAWTKESVDTHIPFLQAFNIDSIDQSGFLGSLFPPAETHDFNESSDKTNLRVFDYGFKTGISYTADFFRLNLNYTLGIPDYRIDRGTDYVKAHQYLSLSVAYNFRIGKSGASSFD